MPAKLKIEINTAEHFQVLPLKAVSFKLESDQFEASADIITYELNEFIATKLRAQYQRRKGRDLFDIWYIVKQGLVDLDQVFEIFAKYCDNDNTKIRKEDFLNNLSLKKSHPDFQSDMSALLPLEQNWNFEDTYKFVIDKVISRIQVVRHAVAIKL